MFARYCPFLATVSVMPIFLFVMADIDDSKLIDDTEVINSTFHHNKTGCQMTFDDDYSAYWVYSSTSLELWLFCPATSSRHCSWIKSDAFLC